MGETVGFVGLGAMGMPMTEVLAAAGTPMVVTDVDAGARQRAATLAGVRAVDSHAEVAAQVDLLFSCVPNNKIARAVYLDADGIAAAGNQGLVTVDCSTVSPSVSQAIYADLRDRGISHMDASMLGSTPQAAAGQLGFVVGGDAAAFARAEPYLNHLGKMVRHAGPSGAGNRIKLIHQTLVATNAVAVAEALALCLATDTDLDAFYDVVCNGGGVAHSRYFETRTPRMRDGDFSPLFMLDLMTKDAGLCGELAREAGMATPHLDQVVAILRDGQAAGLGREDFSAVTKLYETAIGKRLADAGQRGGDET